MWTKKFSRYKGARKCFLKICYFEFSFSGFPSSHYKRDGYFKNFLSHYLAFIYSDCNFIIKLWIIYFSHCFVFWWIVLVLYSRKKLYRQICQRQRLARTSPDAKNNAQKINLSLTLAFVQRTNQEFANFSHQKRCQE